MKQAIKEMGLYALIFFTVLTATILIPIQLVIINEVLGKHLTPHTMTTISWIFCTWMLWIPIAAGLTIGIRLKEKRKE